MIDSIYIEDSLRIKALQKLEVFIANPGRFCLVVLGKRGTGKHFSIEKAFEKIKQNHTDDKRNELCLKDLMFLEQPFNILESSEKLDKFIEENEFNTIVFEDVDTMNEEQQKLLFDALVTKEGAKFGIKDKKYKLRFIFTSSKDSDILRQDGKILQGYFWDRISQLIVAIPSYKDDKDCIMEDFYYTWEKMQFQNIEEYKSLAGCPKNIKLETLIKNNAENFEGGFRDLDKFCCLYFNYRILHYNDKRKILEEFENNIVDNVRDDFFSNTQLLESNENDWGVFRFNRGRTGKELLNDYKAQLKKWSAKEYGGIGKAEEKLGFKKGTMKNYGKD